MPLDLKAEHESLCKWPWELSVINVGEVIQKCDAAHLGIDEAIGLLKQFSEVLEEADELTIEEMFRSGGDRNADRSSLIRHFLRAIWQLNDHARADCMWQVGYSSVGNYYSHELPLHQSRELRELLWFALSELVHTDTWKHPFEEWQTAASLFVPCRALSFRRPRDCEFTVPALYLSDGCPKDAQLRWEAATWLDEVRSCHLVLGKELSEIWRKQVPSAMKPDPVFEFMQSPSQTLANAAKSWVIQVFSDLPDDDEIQAIRSSDRESIDKKETRPMESTAVLEKLRDGFERAGYVAFDIEGWLVISGRTAEVTIPEFESKCFTTLTGGVITIGTNQSDVQAYTRLATRAGRELQGLHNPDEACQWWTETVFKLTGQRKLKVGNVTVPADSLEQLASAGHENFQKVRERIGTPSGWFSHLPDMLDASVQTIDVLIAELQRPPGSSDPATSPPGTETQSSSRIPPEYLDSDGEQITSERMAFLLDDSLAQFNRWVAGTSDCPYLAEGTRVVGHKFQGVRPKLFLKSTLDTLLAGKKRVDRKLKR